MECDTGWYEKWWMLSQKPFIGVFIRRQLFNYIKESYLLFFNLKKILHEIIELLEEYIESFKKEDDENI